MLGLARQVLVLAVEQGGREATRRDVEQPAQMRRIEAWDAVGRAREGLHERRSGRPNGRHLVEPVRPGVCGEAEIGARAAGEVLPFLVEICSADHRPRMRVLDDRRHAGAQCGRGARREVLARGVGRVHQVDVHVHHAREYEQSRRVDDVVSRVALVADGGDTAVIHVDVGSAAARRRDDLPTLDAEPVAQRP